MIDVRCSACERAERVASIPSAIWWHAEHGECCAPESDVSGSDRG